MPEKALAPYSSTVAWTIPVDRDAWRSVQSLSRVRLFATPWTAAHQASLSITNSWSLLKLISIESVMPSNKSPPTRRVPPRGTPRVPAPLPLSPFSPPDRDRRGDSPAFPCPRDSPGKNTGVGCHFLLQCMKAKSESEVAQLCPTLSDPMVGWHHRLNGYEFE